MSDSRLRCCVCGADLGDAEDPYRDPSCVNCLNRAEYEVELARAAEEDERDLLEEDS